MVVTIAHKYSEIERKFMAELTENVFTEMVDTPFSEICDFNDERRANKLSREVA